MTFGKKLFIFIVNVSNTVFSMEMKYSMGKSRKEKGGVSAVPQKKRRKTDEQTNGNKKSEYFALCSSWNNRNFCSICYQKHGNRSRKAGD
ncbi:MAG TPA: hypothetical protein DDY31_11870 [Lachnospiraceae bacterium]|nr:hypothetical protein [Lachnospiraceae bacterium]